MNEANESWYATNQRTLVAALDRVRRALERYAAPPVDTLPHEDEPEDDSTHAFALGTLCTIFDLSPFERDVLLLCAGIELDGRFATLCSAAHGDEQKAYPTLSLALAALPMPQWGALTPAAPLRRWRLIEVGPGTALTTSPLRINERVLHYLAGVQYVDERLARLVEPVTVPATLVRSHAALAEQIATIWVNPGNEQALPMIELRGGDSADQRGVAAVASTLLGRQCWMLSAQEIPLDSYERDEVLRLWEREAALGKGVLLFECDNLQATDVTRINAVERLIATIGSPLIVTGRERRTSMRSVVMFDLPRPTTAEQHTLWIEQLGQAAEALNGHVMTLASQFKLDAAEIRTICATARARSTATNRTQLEHVDAAALWDLSRMQSRQRIDDLAQRIEPAATWDDLVVPEAQQAMLYEIAVHVRQRVNVYENWGFGSKSARGLGISALFAGGSGTGKTMAAEVLANELRLDLYRIDLSSIVSKYIGETEKNLRRVFDAAEAGGAILLFDEADALFGRRSEVKDSHDRYANIEVSYLLQRMESYRGLAILTTNMKDALDQAFLRRIRFVVQFPFPDVEQRAEIWRRVFPVATPTEGLDVARLSRLNIAGGNVRNIALHAAFIASDAEEPVQMRHLLQAARSEYAKLGKALSTSEIKDWV